METIERKIIRGSAKFEYAFGNSSQLLDWMQSNPEFTGVAFVGRSNVGKSSLINALFGNKTARTSKTPGRTREIIIFSFDVTSPIEGEKPTTLTLVDLPGYGHANVSKEMSRNWNQLMTDFFNYLPPSVVLINVQDARHPNQKADQEFNKYIHQFDLNTMLVLNKIDKLKKQKERSELKKKRKLIKEEYHWLKWLTTTSAETKIGTVELEQKILSFLLDKHSENQEGL